MPTSQRHAQMLDWLVENPPKFAPMIALGAGELSSWSEGVVKARWRINETFRLPDGSMFGGYIAALADQILALATFSVLPEDDDRFRTANLQTNFFRPLTGEWMNVEARVVNVSRRLIHVEGDFMNEDGKVAAHCTAVQSRRKAE
ncbi:MAG: PaaI family thioesterase [Pseudomonadota bacterium]